MAYTINQYCIKHGDAILTAVSATTNGATIIAMCIDGAKETYGFPSSEVGMTEEQKELVALTALCDMGGTLNNSMAVGQGAIQSVEVGSDGLPKFTFADRARTFTMMLASLKDKLALMQKKLGYVPYLSPEKANPVYAVKGIGGFDSNEHTVRETISVEETTDTFSIVFSKTGIIS